MIRTTVDAKVPTRFAAASLIALVFLNMLGFGIIVPLLPFYAKSFGAPAWQIALIFSAYSIGTFFGEPFWGRLSDRYGRKPLLIFTIVANAICYIALAFAPTAWAAFFIRLAGGLFSGNGSTIQAYIADVTPAAQRPRAMGYLSAAWNVGLIVGPSVGGLLAHPSGGHAGFRLPLFAAAALFATSAICIALFIRESRVRDPSATHRPSPWGAAAETVRHPVIGRLMWLTFVSGFAFQGIEAIFALWTDVRYAWGPREIGVAFGIIGIVSAASQLLLTEPLARRLGQGPALGACMALIAVTLALQPFSGSGAVTVALLALTAIGQSLSWPYILAMISQTADPHRQGQVLGLNNAVSALSRVAGPLSTGLAFSNIGEDSPYFMTALVVIPMVWLALAAARRAAAATPH